VRGVGLTVGSAQPRVWAEAIVEQIHCPSDAARKAGLQRARAHDWPRLIAPWLERYRVQVEARRGHRPAPLPKGVERPPLVALR
jgi:hypothetical protein